jgi:hypothetical protein
LGASNVPPERTKKVPVLQAASSVLLENASPTQRKHRAVAASRAMLGGIRVRLGKRNASTAMLEVFKGPWGGRTAPHARLGSTSKTRSKLAVETAGQASTKEQQAALLRASASSVRLGEDNPLPARLHVSTASPASTRILQARRAALHARPDSTSKTHSRRAAETAGQESIRAAQAALRRASASSVPPARGNQPLRRLRALTAAQGSSRTRQARRAALPAQPAHTSKMCSSRAAETAVWGSTKALPAALQRANASHAPVGRGNQQPRRLRASAVSLGNIKGPRGRQFASTAPQGKLLPLKLLVAA